MAAETDVFERLREGGIDPASVNTVIWRWMSSLSDYE